jgi:hypothetical protein
MGRIKAVSEEVRGLLPPDGLSHPLEVAEEIDACPLGRAAMLRPPPIRPSRA